MNQEMALGGSGGLSVKASEQAPPQTDGPTGLRVAAGQPSLEQPDSSSPQTMVDTEEGEDTTDIQEATNPAAAQRQRPRLSGSAEPQGRTLVDLFQRRSVATAWDQLRSSEGQEDTAIGGAHPAESTLSSPSSTSDLRAPTSTDNALTHEQLEAKLWVVLKQESLGGSRVNLVAQRTCVALATAFVMRAQLAPDQYLAALEAHLPFACTYCGAALAKPAAPPQTYGHCLRYCSDGRACEALHAVPDDLRQQLDIPLPGTVREIMAQLQPALRSSDVRATSESGSQVSDPSTASLQPPRPNAAAAVHSRRTHAAFNIAGAALARLYAGASTATATTLRCAVSPCDMMAQKTHLVWHGLVESLERMVRGPKPQTEDEPYVPHVPAGDAARLLRVHGGLLRYSMDDSMFGRLLERPDVLEAVHIAAIHIPETKGLWEQYWPQGVALHDSTGQTQLGLWLYLCAHLPPSDPITLTQAVLYAWVATYVPMSAGFGPKGAAAFVHMAAKRAELGMPERCPSVVQYFTGSVCAWCGADMSKMMRPVHYLEWGVAPTYESDDEKTEGQKQEQGQAEGQQQTEGQQQGQGEQQAEGQQQEQGQQQATEHAASVEQTEGEQHATEHAVNVEQKEGQQQATEHAPSVPEYFCNIRVRYCTKQCKQKHLWDMTPSTRHTLVNLDMDPWIDELFYADGNPVYYTQQRHMPSPKESSYCQKWENLFRLIGECMTKGLDGQMKKYGGQTSTTAAKARAGVKSGAAPPVLKAESKPCPLGAALASAGRPAVPQRAP